MSTYAELENFTQENHKQCKVVAMPDFFLDRLINLDWTVAEFSNLIGNVAKRKGGSIDGVPQTDLRGGNAVNVAVALTSLGAEVTPIVCTSQRGLEQMKHFFEGTAVNTSRVKVCGKPSITTALEFKDGNAKTNVMIRDIGALAEFGPEDLDEADYGLIDKADYTCVFNWAGTLRHGTELAKAVFERVKKNGVGRTYFDTADPTPNNGGIPELIEKILKSRLIDVLSVNENEAVVYASLLEKDLFEEKRQLSFEELAMEAARVLAKHLHARIDLHTTAFSATLRGPTEVVAPTFKIKVLRATGAGDAWTAGNIIGDHNGLSDMCRLTLANAVSACYLTDPEGKHPTWQGIYAFLKNQKN